MEKRIGNLENTVAVHEHKIGELDSKHLGIEDRLTSIEKNLMKEQVKSIEKNIANTLDEVVDDISNEAEKYFGNDKKKKGIFIEGVEILQKNIITEITGAVTDEKNTDSAIYKINQTVADFTESFEALLGQHIEDQNESISDNFDLGETDSIG